MTEDLKHYLCVLFSKLSIEERREIIAYLEDMNLCSDIALQDAVYKIREKRFNIGFFCPSCNSKQIVRFGCYRDRQRYRCKSCKKTFTDLTKTALHYIRYKEKFFHAIRCMLDGCSLTKTAKRVKVSIPTAFSWRHKILNGLRCLEDDFLFGIVEADDTFFLYSQKGSRNLERPARKRGGKAKKRGISNGQVCILVARDRNDNTITEIATFGRPSAEEIDRVVGDNLAPDTIFCTDKHPSFKRFARQKGLQYQGLNLSQGIKVVKGIYHIQNVNSYHSRLKIWMKRFKGVATKYLSNYLRWFEFIDSIGKDKIQKVAERDLLLRACSVKAA